MSAPAPVQAPVPEQPAEAPIQTVSLPEQAAAAIQGEARKLFKFSTYLHVGEGAETCPHVVHVDAETGDVTIDGECPDPEHFHAWCRLPNGFQHTDIREKAAAAKARRVRSLRDPESDAYAILEAEMEDLLAHGDADTIIDDILSRDWSGDYLKAINELDHREEFATLAQDRERLEAIEQMPEDERSQDEIDAINKLIADYVAAVDEELKATQAPRRQAYSDLAKEELIEVLRKQRIEADCQEEYLAVYNRWEWYAGTYKVALHPATRRPHQRAFATIDEMTREQSPEVIEELKLAFADLENGLHRGTAAGNS